MPDYFSSLTFSLRMARQNIRSQLPNPPGTEARRQQRETKNGCSPLSELPGELRNVIYELAIPQDQVFNTTDEDTALKDHWHHAPDFHCDPAEGAKEEKIYEKGTYVARYECTSVHSSRAHERTFNLSQVCRQLRKETLKLYYSNIFLLRVIIRRKKGKKMNRLTRGPSGTAEQWMRSRPAEALLSCSRIILQHWNPDYIRNIQGMQMGLFDLNSETWKAISFKNVMTCEQFDEASRMDLTLEVCPACFESVAGSRKTDFKGVSKAVGGISTEEKPGKTLNHLIQTFRDSFKD